MCLWYLGHPIRQVGSIVGNQGLQSSVTLPRIILDDFGRAVSRILSAPLVHTQAKERIICLSSQYPGPVPACGTWSGQLRGPLFGLAPDGVFRTSALALGAVGSYPAFSPLPSGPELLQRQKAVYFLWHYPSGPELLRGTSRVYPRPNRGYAASRPLVFGLSSSTPPKRNESDPPPFQNRGKYTGFSKDYQGWARMIWGSGSSTHSTTRTNCLRPAQDWF